MARGKIRSQLPADTFHSRNPRLTTKSADPRRCRFADGWCGVYKPMGQGHMLHLMDGMIGNEVY